jgi:hypothetical protein
MPLSGLAMRCARCQNENPTDARFCNGCGDPIGHPDVSAAEMRAERKDKDGERYVSAMTPRSGSQENLNRAGFPRGSVPCLLRADQVIQQQALCLCPNCAQLQRT